MVAMVTVLEIVLVVAVAGVLVGLAVRLAERATPKTIKPLPRADFEPEAIAERYDVIIIGGGPAGSSAALRMARAGVTVLVLEKQPMPRRKLCGGALSGQAQGYLDVDLPDSLVDNVAYGATFQWRHLKASAKLDKPIVRYVTRANFDQYLLGCAEKAGATVRTEAAQSVAFNGEWLRVRTLAGDYGAQLLLVADGATGRFARLVRRPDTDDERGFCLEAEIPVEQPDRFAKQSDMMDLTFDLAGHGYGWVFHHGRYYSVGMGALVSHLPKPRALMESYLRQQGFDSKPEGMKGHLIPRGGLTRQIVGERCLLIGDAGGFVEPFSGEGLAYAIRSGQLAADTAVRCVRERNFGSEALQRFAVACRREFKKNIRWGLFLDECVRRHPEFFFKLLAANPRILSYFLTVGQGRRTYAHLVRYVALRLPLFWWKARKLPPA